MAGSFVNAAETGFGVDVGGGIAWPHPSGFRLELGARGLLAHEESDFGEWGVSGALRYAPSPDSGRGVSLSLTPSFGVSTTGGGTDALFRHDTLAGLVFGGTRPEAGGLRGKLA